MANNFLGKADTATQLATVRTIFGKAFSGNANVEGRGSFYGNGTATSRYSNGAIEIRESLLVTNTQSSSQYAPRIGFHWANKWGKSLIMDGSGYFKFVSGDDDATLAPLFAEFHGNLTGNATTATTATTAGKWTTARTLSLSGNASGSVSIDGSANVVLNISNSYAASSNQSNYLLSKDTRNDNPAPKDINTLARFEFKSNSAISSPGAGTYSGLMTFAPYNDASGGNKYQINFSYFSGANIPHLSIRTAGGGETTWKNWYYMPVMDQTNGYWGIKFPSNDTYLRTPPTGLLPYGAGNPSTSVLGTSSWRFASAYINTVYGNLSGNATSATTATTATNANQLGGVAASGYLQKSGGALSSSASEISRAGTSTSWVAGRTAAAFKTTTSGTSWYSPLWSCKSYQGSWDCGTYTSNNLHFSYISDTDFNAGTNRQTANIFFSPDGSITATSFKGNATTATTASNSNSLGGIGASSYINTSDTLVLRGTV